MEETKKGFLAIGIIVLICIGAAAALAILGWGVVKNSGVLDQVNAGFSRLPIDLERTGLEAYIQGLGYSCDPAEVPSNRDYEFVNCSKQVRGESFTLGITYSKKSGKPVSLNLSIRQSGNKEQKEIIAMVFAELARIPYAGSSPDEAAAWVRLCMEFEDVDYVNIAKTISGVSFTFYIYDDQYQLSIGSDYEYD